MGPVRLSSTRRADRASGTVITADLRTIIDSIGRDAGFAEQLTKHRLASGFQSPVRVAAKSGSLAGVVRNEIGVITYPGGRGYAAAVFCQAHQPWQGDPAINAAIGAAAAAAFSMLSGPAT